MPIDDNYNDVPARIAEFREKYPEGVLRQESLQFIDFAGTSWVVYTAAAYRSPEDPCPAHGTAWEVVPGRTNFTRFSEVQNAETSAWGRAIIAVGAADAKKGIASAHEVFQARQSNTGLADDDTDRMTAGVASASVPLDVQDILRAASISGDKFLVSLATQWKTKGSLSPKQLETGVRSAAKILRSHDATQGALMDEENPPVTRIDHTQKAAEGYTGPRTDAYSNDGEEPF